MVRTLVRLSVATALAGAGLFAAATPASAGCVGTTQTVGVCTAPVVVYEDCVWTGGSGCTMVQVTAPLCVYGWIGPSLQYQTAWC